MKILIKGSAIALTATLLTMGCSDSRPNGDTHEKGEHHTHWGYSGDVAPNNWGKLDEKFKMCSEGKEQSPINVVATKDIELSPLNLNYSKGSKSIINNGHTVQINMVSGDIFTIDGVDYELKQFHFHTPSENHIDGKSFPLEAHFVHASKDGKLAVIAVMFQEGNANPTLSKIIKSFPLKEGTNRKLEFSKDDLNVVMPKSRDYYKFMGSLTTPPCSQNVKWFVLKSPQSASKEQIDAIHKEIGKENNRPIQDSNGREIDK